MKDIKGYEKLYAVTIDGRIWSYPKPSNLPNANCLLPGKWLKLQLFINRKNRIKPHSQYTVGLYKNLKNTTHQVHRLVGLTYIPNPENLPQINHLDGDSLNNHVSNLEWSTATHNMEHAQENGLLSQFTEKQIKARSNNGKLTGAINGMKARRLFSMNEAECIRKIHEIGKKSCRAIAKIYNCSNVTISNICNNKSYQLEA